MIHLVKGNIYVFRFCDSKIYFAQDSFQKVAGMVLLKITSLVKSTLFFIIHSDTEEKWERFHEMSLRLNIKVTLKVPAE